MHALVTLVGEHGVDLWFNRDIARRCSHFTRHFRLLDLRSYDPAENPAEVTILDRIAMFAVLFLQEMDLEAVTERLAGTRNLVFLSGDLHSWAIFPDEATMQLSERVLRPEDSNARRLLAWFERLVIRHLVTTSDCPELDEIRRLNPELRTHVVELGFDPTIYCDYRLTKKYDLVIYGSLKPNAYAFRSRVRSLLLEAGRFSIIDVRLDSPFYDPKSCGAGLARKVAECRLGLATATDFEYLLPKYFEIPACRTVVLGDMPRQGRAIFGDDYVHIDETMSDEAIVDTVAAALADPESLAAKADRMFATMHKRFTLAEHERRLAAIADRIAEE